MLDRVPGRLDPVRCAGAEKRRIGVFVDYAHTDDALKNVLQTLKPLCRGRLIVVFGCGGDRDPVKRPLMAEAVKSGADIAVAEIPLPVPIVVNPIAREWTILRRAKPEIVVEIIGCDGKSFFANIGTPTKDKTTSHIDTANDAVAHQLHNFL